MNTGDKIKNKRKELKLTQKQLAESTGLSIATIQKYEYNQMAPKLEQLDKLSKVLNCSAMNLLGDEIDIFDKWDLTIDKNELSKEINYYQHLNEVFKFNGYNLDFLTEDINEQFEYDVNVLIKFLALKYNLTKEGE